MNDDSKEDVVLGGRLDSQVNNYQACLDRVDKIRRLIECDKEIQSINPCIVVCGDQSMGKSSVLETITGVNLPRGDGMKTRVPLELQVTRFI